MKTISRPTKEQVRDWLHTRHEKPTPLPSNDQIRRQLGWGLVAAQGAAKELSD